MVGRSTWILIVVTVIGCSAKKDATFPSAAMCDTSVKYSWDDTNQETRKTTEYLNSVTGKCSEKRLQLNNYEKGLDVRKRAKATCKPQPLGSAYLKADSNFYGPRNGNVWLALEASGEFRRLTLGQDQNGKPMFSRDLGCWYARSDHETEPVNPKDYGSQILLDLGPLAASTELVRPIEIFKYARSGTAWQMTRFDQNDDIDYSFCPYSLTPPEFCSALRNGNPYFEPDNLDATTKTDLLNQAILIRSEYNYIEVTQAEFESAWSQSESSYTESPIQSWKYAPTMFVDVPNYVWDAWAGYVRGDLPTMPDAYAVNVPVVCYPARRQVTYSDGSPGYISGTACYDSNGGYTFQ